VKLAVRLGDLHLQMDSFGDAEKAYQEPCQGAWRFHHSAATWRRPHPSLELEDARHWKPGRPPQDDAAKQAYVEARKRRLQVCVEEFAARVRQYPTDVGLKFDYGRYLLETGRFDDAIEQFQNTVSGSPAPGAVTALPRVRIPRKEGI